MKKWIIRLGIAGILLLIITLVLGAVFLGSIVKKGVETVGPQITRTDLKLDAVSLSILSGSGSVKGFSLGNPEGFKSESAIRVNQVEIGMKPMSVFSDKVHVQHVRMIGPEITFEVAGINVRANNLNKILENVQAAAGPAKTEPEPAGPATKLQVDDFLLSGAKVRITSTSWTGQAADVTIPDIHFTDLGTGPEGITAAELTRRVLNEVVEKAIVAAQSSLGDPGKGATGLLNASPQYSTGAVNKAAQGITTLLKKRD